MLKKLLCFALLALLPAAAQAHTRDQVRAAYRAVTQPTEASVYAETPAVKAPYAPGALTDAARADALAYLNFIRWLAGLEPVTDSAIYDFQCQHGAVLLAALDYVDHDAPCPVDMDRDFYDAAHLGTGSSNIAKLNWLRPSILRDGIEYFLRDDGEANLATLGHRRWALNPMMAATGFGCANSAPGSSYVFMFAHDLARPDATWDTVAWPAPGAFPASLMHGDLAWSLTLNPAVYDLAASSPRITLSEEASGLSFRFQPADGIGDGFCALNRETYGPGPCLIFRPDFAGTGFADYQQNQRWTVRVEGLAGADGADASIEYTVEMISLAVQDAAAVEVSPLEAALAPGETLSLAASVIPAYADDLTVAWSSTDEAVATVAADGTVTAVAPGECHIVAATANGREDRCAVRVAD